MLNNSVQRSLAERISLAPGRAISFAEAMETALYMPEGGYYAQEPRKIGRKGDFYTSVSVGPLYGRLIAEAVNRVWEGLGRTDDFTLIEQGAHDGQLMEDVHQGLVEMGSILAYQADFCIIEPQELYRQAQEKRLRTRLGPRFGWADRVEDLIERPAHGFFMTNELLDAFPVHRVQWTGETWIEIGVGFDESGFVWKPMLNSPTHLQAEIARLPTDLPPGHTTEVHPAAREWMNKVGATRFSGALLVADYGLDDEEYDSVERSDGTVRRYRGHQMDGHVLRDLGECDITAHVRFSPLLECAKSAGFREEVYLDQGRFLTRLATPWLKTLEKATAPSDTAASLRQFNTLTHPGQMGTRFRMCLLTRGIGKGVF